MSKYYIIGLLCITVTVIITSCSTATNTEVNCPVIKLDYKDQSLSDIPKYKNITFVPLETRKGALIGNINKIVVSDNRYYVLDFFSAEAVFIYDLEGALINVIDSKGKGPGEYVGINDIGFDPFNLELIVVDSQLKKILKYNPDGDFISEIFFDFPSYNIGFVDKETYAFSTRIDKFQPGVKTIKHNGDNEHNVYFKVLEFSLSNWHYFPRYKTNQFYFENLKDTIWRLSKDKAEPYLIIDFDERKINTTELEDLKIWANQNGRVSRLPKNKSGKIDVFLETEKFIQFFCMNLKNRALVLINKESMEVLNIANGGDHKSNPLAQVIWSVHTVDNAGRFIGYISADRYIDLIQTDHFMDLADKGVVHVSGNGYPDQKDVNINSNPVIAVMELDSSIY